MALTASQLAYCAVIFGLGTTVGHVVSPVVQKAAVRKAKPPKPKVQPVASAAPTERASIMDCLLPAPVWVDMGHADIPLAFTPIGTAQMPPAPIGGGFGPVVAPGVPEPSAWAMLIVGFGLVGVSMRRRPAIKRTIS